MQRLIVAILHETNGESALQALTRAGFRATRIASTGSFLRRRDSTLLIGLEQEQVEPALQILRTQSAPAVDPGLKRGTIFVLKVDRFEQI